MTTARIIITTKSNNCNNKDKNNLSPRPSSGGLSFGSLHTLHALLGQLLLRDTKVNNNNKCSLFNCSREKRKVETDHYQWKLLLREINVITDHKCSPGLTAPERHKGLKLIITVLWSTVPEIKTDHYQWILLLRDTKCDTGQWPSHTTRNENCSW